MQIYYPYKVRLYPTKTQTQKLNLTFGHCRFIWNKMLEERKRVFEETKESPELRKNHKFKTEKIYKKEFEFLKDVSTVALQQSRRNLESAYQSFFNSISGKRKGRKVNIPRFKKKRIGESFRTINSNKTNHIRIHSGNRISIPKIGKVKFRDSRNIVEQFRSVTVSRSSDGKYWASILVLKDIKIKQSQGNKVIGLDMGMKDFFTDNQGNKIKAPKTCRKFQSKLAKEQRKLKRKVKGSNNRFKQLIKVNRVYCKIRNIRRDFLHKLSTKIVQEFDIIKVEDIDYNNMSQSLNLGKSVTDNGWGEFRDFLEYKSLWQGKSFEKVDRFFPSTKLCSECGYKNNNLKLKYRKWICPECKTTHDRDVNAAINIANFKKQNTAGTVEIQACGDKRDLALSMKQES